VEFGGERMDVHSEIYGGADLMHIEGLIYGRGRYYEV
jgi:hypothetical protein